MRILIGFENIWGQTWVLSSTIRCALEMNHIELILQVGARGIGSGHSSDFEDALKLGVKFFTGNKLYMKGIKPVLEQINEIANLIICIDIDAMDLRSHQIPLGVHLVV